MNKKKFIEKRTILYLSNKFRKLKIPKGKIKKFNIKKVNYKIIYVSKQDIEPAFGIDLPEKRMALVRKDLPKRIKKFVTCHELYHLRDKAKWGGWVGRELRASITCVIKNPIGSFLTLIVSLKPDRLKLYFLRFKYRK